MTEDNVPQEFVMQIWNGRAPIGRYEINRAGGVWISSRVTHQTRHALPKAKTFDSAIRNCLTNFGEFQPHYTFNIGITKQAAENNTNAPIALGQVIEGHIDGLGSKGDGLMRVGGMVIFVPGAKENTVVRVRITRVLEKNAFGELIVEGGEEE